MIPGPCVIDAPASVSLGLVNYLLTYLSEKAEAGIQLKFANKGVGSK